MHVCYSLGCSPAAFGVALVTAANCQTAMNCHPGNAHLHVNRGHSGATVQEACKGGSAGQQASKEAPLGARIILFWRQLQAPGKTHLANLGTWWSPDHISHFMVNSGARRGCVRIGLDSLEAKSSSSDRALPHSMRRTPDVQQIESDSRNASARSCSGDAHGMQAADQVISRAQGSLTRLARPQACSCSSCQTSIAGSQAGSCSSCQTSIAASHGAGGPLRQ